MNIIRKCPVEKPCEASSFEEAFRKNKVRLSFERQECEDLVAAMKKDGEKTDGLDPEFWRGCEAANNRAYFIYQEEMKKLRERIAIRLAETSLFAETRSKEFKKGFEDVNAQWIKALKIDDPKAIVWW